MGNEFKTHTNVCAYHRPFYSSIALGYYIFPWSNLVNAKKMANKSVILELISKELSDRFYD